MLRGATVREAPGRFFYFSSDWLRKADGLAPVVFRKVLLKWNWSGYPTLSPTSRMVRSVSVSYTHLSKRPTSLDYIETVFEEFMELHGDRAFRDDGAIVGGLAVLDGQPVTCLLYTSRCV